MMEREGGRGSGSLKIRFYNRPTREMVKDAAYITLPLRHTGPGRFQRGMPHLESGGSRKAFRG